MRSATLNRPTAGNGPAWSKGWLDVTLAAALFAASTGIAAWTFDRFRLAHVIDAPEFNDHVFGAALMQVCGRPGVFPSFSPDEKTHAPTKSVHDFIQGRRDTIRCDELPASLTLFELDPLLHASRYLIELVALAWVPLAPSWHGIAGLAGLFFGVTVVAMYLSCRLTIGAMGSGIVAGLIALSPLQLWNVADLRDFSKAPFFALALFTCGLLATRTMRRPMLIAVAAAIGIVLGFGFGVRTDVALNLVAVLVTIGVFLPPDAGLLRTKMLALVICLGAFAVAALPILKVKAGGGNVWHWSLLGLSHGFDEALEMGETPYHVSFFYDDLFVATTVDAYNGRIHHEAGPASVNSASYEQVGREYFFRIVRTFPADFAARAWASLLGVLNLPFRAARPGAVNVPPAGRLLSRAFQWRGKILQRLDRVGAPLCVAVLCGIAATNLRLATFVLVLVCFFGMYPAVQYHPRHFFQLEFLGLWFAAFGATSVIGLLREPRAVSIERLWPPGASRRVALFALAVALVVIVPLGVLRSYQQRAATLLLRSYQQARLEAVPFDTQARSPGMVRLTPTGRHRRAEELIRSEMIVTSLGSPACRVDHLTLAFRYLTKNPGIDFSRTVTVPVSGASANDATVFMPIFETRTVNPAPDLLTFAGIDVRVQDLPCIGGVSRFQDPSAFPLLLEAVLPSGWQTLPLYQTVRPVEAALTRPLT